MSTNRTGRRTGTPSDPGYDLKLRFKVASGNGKGEVWWIHAVIKTVVHPRQARQAIWDLHRSPAIPPEGEGVYSLLIAPHISESVAAMCEEAQFGHLDLSGNCNIEFGGIWIDRQRIERKYKEEQRQKSIYTPKASRILRVLLQGPLRPHKVEDLANAAEVSLGLVSKIRKVLLNEEVAIDTKDGLQIKHPQAILRDWILKDDFSQRTQVREYAFGAEKNSDNTGLATALRALETHFTEANQLGPTLAESFYHGPGPARNRVCACERIW